MNRVHKWSHQFINIPLKYWEYLFRITSNLPDGWFSTGCIRHQGWMTFKLQRRSFKNPNECPSVHTFVMINFQYSLQIYKHSVSCRKQFRLWLSRSGYRVFYIFSTVLRRKISNVIELQHGFSIRYRIRAIKYVLIKTIWFGFQTNKEC